MNVCCQFPLHQVGRVKQRFVDTTNSVLEFFLIKCRLDKVHLIESCKSRVSPELLLLPAQNGGRALESRWSIIPLFGQLARWKLTQHQTNEVGRSFRLIPDHHHWL